MTDSSDSKNDASDPIATGVRMRLENVDLYRGTTKTFSADRVDIPSGTLTAVVGLSGSGKSTFLECLSGNLRPQTGKLFVDDKPLSDNLQKHQSELAYIPQQDIVHSEVTVRQAMRFASLIRLGDKAFSDEQEKNITSLLKRLGIFEVVDQRVGTLSGGQRTRVSTATELVSSPRLLLLDEPTAGLDPANHRSFMQLLRELADSGCTVVVTTHHTEKLELSDRVVLLGDGTVIDQAPPDQLLKRRQCESFTELFDQAQESDPPKKEESPEHSALLDSILTPVRPFYLVVKGILFWSFVLVRDFLRVLYLAVTASLTRPVQSVIFAVRHLFPRQIGLLQREQIVLFQHPAFMSYLFLLPAIIGVLIGIVSNIHTDPSRTMFLSIVGAFWLGISTSSLSIIREYPIIERERMASPYQETYVVAYLSSKVIWYGLMGLIVGLLLVGGLFLTGSIHYAPPEYGFRILMSILLIEIASLLGVVIGLLVSTISENQVFAMALIPLIVLPGILLSRVALNKLPHEPVGTPEVHNIKEAERKDPIRTPSPDDDLLPAVWYWMYRIHPISFLYDGAPLSFRPDPENVQKDRKTYLQNLLIYTLIPSLILAFLAYFLTHLILLFRGRLGIGRFFGRF